MGQVFEQRASVKIGAQLLDGFELETAEPDSFSGENVIHPVVEKERFVGANAQFFAGEVINCRIGFGDAEFAGPGELIEGGEPSEFLAHGAQNLRNHIGENGGEEAGVLKRADPGEHGLADVGPHEDVGLDEGVDLRGCEAEAAVASEFGPVAVAVHMAKVVFVAVAPVETLKSLAIEAGEGDEVFVGGGVRGAEDLTVVEDDGAQHKVQGIGAARSEKGEGRRKKGEGLRWCLRRSAFRVRGRDDGPCERMSG